jgi:peptidoglycan biosynthesis protein MviN/MurJ (putative lipid II flippase)
MPRLRASLAQVGIALVSLLSCWFNVVLLAVVLLARGHWKLDPWLTSRTWHMAVATIVMSGGLMVLKPAVPRPDLMDVAGLLGLCKLGGLAYAAAPELRSASCCCASCVSC